MEAWYIVAQQIRERHAEAREAARIQALTRDPATTARRPSSVGITLGRLAKCLLGSSNGGRRKTDSRTANVADCNP
jgi:hypothetical protein